MKSQKELLGMWLSENEGAKFWLNVLTELQNRDVKDIFIACVNGLKGFPDAIKLFPKHSNLALYRPYVEKLDKICAVERLQGGHSGSENHLPTENEVLLALEKFADKWYTKYPQISRSWTTHWENTNTLFNYPEDIRKAIYTTNVIESLNSVIRKAIKKTQAVPNR
ncbi:TPA: transposase [Vibrio alginolyticus]|nr:transposase [Vibrio parahaemolyticus]